MMRLKRRVVLNFENKREESCQQFGTIFRGMAAKRTKQNSNCAQQRSREERQNLSVSTQMQLLVLEKSGIVAYPIINNDVTVMF